MTSKINATNLDEYDLMNVDGGWMWDDNYGMTNEESADDEKVEATPMDDITFEEGANDSDTGGSMILNEERAVEEDDKTKNVMTEAKSHENVSKADGGERKKVPANNQDEKGPSFMGDEEMDRIENEHASGAREPRITEVIHDIFTEA